MNAPEFAQVVVDPEDKTAALMLRLIEEVKDDDDGKPRWAWAKLFIGKWVHALGIHTWVRWRHYDRASDSIIDMNGKVCQWCSKARLR